MIVLRLHNSLVPSISRIQLNLLQLGANHKNLISTVNVKGPTSAAYRPPLANSTLLN